MGPEYGLKKAESSLPRDLMVVPHEGGDLVGSFFGPGSYGENVAEMNKKYFHSDKLPRISFRPANSSESISAAAYGFGDRGDFDAKRDIFMLDHLQIPHCNTGEGVFTNPFLIERLRGMTIEDSTTEGLMRLLDDAEEVNGIYLSHRGFAFAPYGSFRQGIQDPEEFAGGGLARALEHTRENVAPNLLKIASHYHKGIKVFGFEPIGGKLKKKLAALGVDRYFGRRLYVDGYGWVDGGHAFGEIAGTTKYSKFCSP